MPAVDSFVAFYPRFTTLVGSPVSAPVPLTSIPLDVTQFAGAQMEAFVGRVFGNMGMGESYFRMYLEESLDGVSWPETMSTRFDFDPATLNATKFFSFGFRLRWFRIRIETNAMLVTCYVEGLMRAGGGGAHEWIATPRPTGAMSTMDARRKRKPRPQQRTTDWVEVTAPSPFKTPMATAETHHSPGGGGPGTIGQPVAPDADPGAWDDGTEVPDDGASRPKDRRQEEEM